MTETIEQQFETLQKQFRDLKRDYEQHIHNGLDSRKLSFYDMDGVITLETTINPGNLADGAGETQQVTVEGANLGDFVLVSAPYDLEDITVTAYVQAQDTVEIRIQNESTSTVNLASDTWRIVVINKLNL